MSAQKFDSALTKRTSYAHWVGEHVRWSDTDRLGHCNNLTFGAFAETGRCLFLKWIIDGTSSESALFLVARLILDFRGELFWPAQVDVGTGVLSVGNSSCHLGQGMFEGDRCVGTGETVIIAIDEATRRPQPISVTLRAWFETRLIAG